MELLTAVGYGRAEEPWLELGVAVNAGVAYVGNVGGAVVDFTALGDPVNITGADATTRRRWRVARRSGSRR